MTPFIVVLASFIIRFALPLLVMAGLVSLLRGLDARWQAEALTKQKLAALHSNHPLDLSECAIEGLSHRPAIRSSEPCWQVFRMSNGYIHEECLQCKVFRAEPVLLPNN